MYGDVFSDQSNLLISRHHRHVAAYNSTPFPIISNSMGSDQSSFDLSSSPEIFADVGYS